MILLSRREFKEKVFKRDGGKCIFCDLDAVDAHHIMDRSLFKSGGYYLDNGVSVCEKHHWDCEKSVVLPEEIRRIAKISEVILPVGYDVHKLYNKFGDVLGTVNYSEQKTPRRTVSLP